jgi:hypothetical protein
MSAKARARATVLMHRLEWVRRAHREDALYGVKRQAAMPGSCRCARPTEHPRRLRLSPAGRAGRCPRKTDGCSAFRPASPADSARAYPSPARIAGRRSARHAPTSPARGGPHGPLGRRSEVAHMGHLVGGRRWPTWATWSEVGGGPHGPLGRATSLPTRTGEGGALLAVARSHPRPSDLISRRSTEVALRKTVRPAAFLWLHHSTRPVNAAIRNRRHRPGAPAGNQ